MYYVLCANMPAPLNTYSFVIIFLWWRFFTRLLAVHLLAHFYQIKVCSAFCLLEFLEIAIC